MAIDEAMADKGFWERTKERVAREWRMQLTGYAFMAPFMILFAVFVITPVLYAIYLSFTYFNILEAPRWIGWTNYRALLVDDDIFLTAIQNTLVFSVLNGPISYAASFTLAWLINRIKRRGLFVLSYYAPSITSAIAMSMVWRYIFSGDRYGYINNILMGTGILDEPIQFLAEQSYIMPAIIIVSLWMSLGTGFLVFLAGLQQVPEELYDAGKVDGIPNAWVELTKITLPMMKPQLLFGAITSITASFAIFEIAVALVGFPSPLYAGHTIVTHMYDYAFVRFEMGYASAIAVVLFVATFLLGRVVMRLLATEE
jgi:multiple sugar transport system permease protein